jgi:hypothetical protein
MRLGPFATCGNTPRLTTKIYHAHRRRNRGGRCGLRGGGRRCARGKGGSHKWCTKAERGCVLHDAGGVARSLAPLIPAVPVYTACPSGCRFTSSCPPFSTRPNHGHALSMELSLFLRFRCPPGVVCLGRPSWYGSGSSSFCFVSFVGVTCDVVLQASGALR